MFFFCFFFPRDSKDLLHFFRSVRPFISSFFIRRCRARVSSRSRLPSIIVIIIIISTFVQFYRKQGKTVLVPFCSLTKQTNIYIRPRFINDGRACVSAVDIIVLRHDDRISIANGQTRFPYFFLSPYPKPFFSEGNSIRRRSSRLPLPILSPYFVLLVANLVS